MVKCFLKIKNFGGHEVLKLYFNVQKDFFWNIKSHKYLFFNEKLKFLVQTFHSSLKNGYFGAIIFQEIEFFEHLKCNFKTSWPPKISIFKKHFTSKITLILMIKKMPLTFLDV